MRAYVRKLLLNRRLRALDIKIAFDQKKLGKSAQLQIEEGASIASASISFQHLSVGASSYIRSGCEILSISKIGRFCSIGNGVILGLERHGHPLDWVSTHPFQHDADGRNFVHPARPARLEHDVWVGREAIIMEGVTIGTGAVIGARTIVTQDVPPYAIFAGTPGRVIRFRHPPEIIAGLLASRWWNLPRNYLSHAPMDKPADFLLHLNQRPPEAQAHYSGLRITRDHMTPLTTEKIPETA